MIKRGWVYIMTNKRGGVLYIGVTADLPARIYQHKTGQGSAFCRKYGLTILVLVEEFPTITEAIAREKAMKAWKRQWKIELIEASNPDWADYSDRLV
ncbi:MAG: GIY-YIG nuclease family protein [Alphaproteobacteria bacterium]|jgi:putative endonuclease|nr:GIY-YIG nuclease family protein [Alphaproteobacteria bacterium]MBU0865653.1 GIY-YIG nuclease family protein [Alphaproteobacteria bacterium]MBU1825284.1 GIY-YIG nuclease family protein [Alphaproteobacteria bacterium]